MHPPVPCQPVSVFSRPRQVVALGVVVTVGFLAVGLVVRSNGGGSGDATSVDLPTPTAAAAEAYAEAVARNRRGTWAVTERTTRTFIGGGPQLLDVVTRRVQRPPDSYVNGNGVVERRLRGRLSTCTAIPTGVGGDVSAGGLRCRDAAAPTVEALQAATDGGIASARALVSGPAPLYSVGIDGTGCFVLVLRTYATLAPPLGRQATICFDPATGAQRRATLIKDGAESSDDVVDETIASDVRGAVTDADFALPEGTQVDRPDGLAVPTGPTSSSTPPATGTTIVLSPDGPVTTAVTGP